MAKVQNEMATRITIDTVEAANSMQALRQAISANTNSWKAMETSLKSAGDYQGAAAERVKGLTQSIELQKQRISELRERQEGLDQSTQHGAQQFVKLESQISQANKQMASYEAQLTRAKSSSEYYAGGLANLQQSYKMLQTASQAYVSRLEAEGKQSEANQARMSGLKQALSNLTSQYEKQESELQKIASTSGTTSEAYLKQKTRLDETGTAVAETNSKISKLNSEMKENHSGFLSGVQSKLDSVNEKASKTSDLFWKITGAHLVANGITSALQSIKAQFSTLIDSAKEYDVDQQKLIATWTTLTGSSSKAKDMRDTINSLAIKTGQATESVNELEQGFYHLHSSKSESDELTKSMLNMADAVGLDSQQIQAVTQDMVNGLSRGKANAGMLNQISQYFPMFREQLAKYETQVNHGKEVTVADLATMAKQGKISAQDIEKTFNSLGSGKYDKAADNMLQTMYGMERTIKSRMPALLGEIYEPIMKMKNPLIGQVSKWTTSEDTKKAFSGVGQALAKQISDIMTAFGGKEANISSNLDGLLLKLQTGINKLGATIVAHKKDIKSFIDSFKTGSATSAKIFVDVLKDMVTVAKPLLDLMAKFPKTSAAIITTGLLASKAIRGLSLTFAGLDIIKTVTQHIKDFSLAQTVATAKTKILTVATKAQAIAQKALDVVMAMNPFTAWAVAIGAVILALVELYKHNAKFRAFVNSLVKACKDFYNGAVKWFGNTWSSIKKGASDAWSNTKKTFSDGWNNLSRATKSGSETVEKWWSQTSTQTSRTAQDMFRQHQKTFESGYKVIQDRTDTWRDFVSGRWDRLGDDTKKTAQDMQNFQRRLFGDLYDWLNKITGGRLGDMLKTWKDKLGAIGDVVSGARDAIHKRFVDLARGIISPFNSMLDGLRKGINWILEKVGASGISGSWSVPMPSYATGTNDTHPGGLAMVNDGQTGHYREMYRLPNGQIGMFPATRNMIVPLPKGTSILDGDSSYRLARILGQTPHYADGIGSFFSGLVNKGKDILEDVDKILAHPIQFAEDVFKKFVNVKTPVNFAKELVENVPTYIAKQMGNWIKKQFEELSNPGGAGVERWRSYIERDLKTLTGSVDATKVAKLLRQIQTESGGNPTIRQQISDINSASGHPAQGLLQFIPSTFNSWALPGHKNILNGNDQILAAINALQHGGEGGWGNVGNGHGWAMGGLISNHGVYEIAENNLPEYVIPTDINKRSRANQLLGEVITQFSSESKAMGNTLAGSSLVSSESEIKTLNSKFDRLLSLVTELIGVNNDQVQAIQDQGSLDMQQVYRKQARDMRMRQTGLGGA